MSTGIYLFDTDTITNILKPSPSEILLDRLKKLSSRQQYICTITLYEIVYGAYKSRRKEYHLDRLKVLLLPAVRIVSFDAKAAYICGAIRADLETKGTPLSLADLQIASIALANDLTLVTGNTKHFERITELNVERWL